jgi:hypothetical protein
MPYGSISVDQINNTTGYSLGAGNASLMKNRIINGAMVIDQRNAGASTTSGTNNGYTLDRWATQNNSGASRFTVQRNAGSITPPAGFSNYLGCTSTGSYTIASGDAIGIIQRIEGYNIADLTWGNASAKTITLSFQVYSSITGTFGGSLFNGNGNYSYPFTYSISSANTWQQISVTITGATSGSWSNDNSTGLNVLFALGTGSSLSGTAGSWSANGYYGATGQTQWVATNGATFYITGVQLEVGSVATGFEYVNYQTSLANCQRYYYVHASFAMTGGNASIGNVAMNTSSDGRCILTFPTTMRTYPSLVQGSGSNYYAGYANGTGPNYFTSFTGITAHTQQTVQMYIQGTNIGSAGNAGWLICSASGGSIAFSAEL